MKLNSSQQTACVKNNFIGEPGWLISDITEITDRFDFEGLPVITESEKAFDSLDHNLLGSVLKKNVWQKFHRLNRDISKSLRMWYN